MASGSPARIPLQCPFLVLMLPARLLTPAKESWASQREALNCA